MKSFVIILLLGIKTFLANAQQRTESIWLSIQLPVKLSPKLSLQNDAGYRTLGISSLPRQFLFRTGLRHHFSKQADAAAGVALFFNRTSLNKEEHEFGNEFRLWQEVQQQIKMMKHTNLLLRLRTEQRFFEQTGVRNSFDAYRFRYRGTLQQRLTNKLQLQAGFEYMHQLESGVNSFNQYRIQPSLLWKMNKQFQVQTMYMIIKSSNEIQRVLWMTLFYNL